MLGSARNSECRIDSISQSWSVLSGVADPQRARQAMDGFEQHLVRPDAALVQLLAPPFDRAEPNPGYIKGYLLGVRENGGQYTHAAVWAGMAYAAMGDARHVYACAQHLGRGGWTWYTGSAGWMCRYSVESLLGLPVRGDQLHLAPSVPSDWDEYEQRYRFRETVYAIWVRRASGAPELMLDGQRQPGLTLPLADDGQPHRVELRINMDAHRSTDDERISHEKNDGLARSDALVVLGATGDLAYKKIFPALFALARRGKLEVPVIGVASSGWDEAKLRQRASDRVAAAGPVDDRPALERMLACLRYVSGDYSAPSPHGAEDGSRRGAAPSALPSDTAGAVRDRDQGIGRGGARFTSARDRRETVRARPGIGAPAQRRRACGVPGGTRSSASIISSPRKRS